MALAVIERHCYAQNWVSNRVMIYYNFFLLDTLTKHSFFKSKSYNPAVRRCKLLEK